MWSVVLWLWFALVLTGAGFFPNAHLAALIRTPSWIALVALLGSAGWAGVVIAQGAATQRARWRLVATDPAGLAEPPSLDAFFVRSSGLFGLVLSVIVLASWVALLFGNRMDFRTTLGMNFCAGLIGASSLFYQVRRVWVSTAGHIAILLTTLGIASLVGLVTPIHAESARPNAFALAATLLAGGAVMVTFWTWLADVWEQQLNEGAAWTTAGRLRFVVVAFARGLHSSVVVLALLLAFLVYFVELPNWAAAWITGGIVVLVLASFRQWRRARTTWAGAVLIAAAASLAALLITLL